MSDGLDPSPELEEIASALRQNAWVLGEYWQALRSAGLPDVVAGEILVDYHAWSFLDADAK